MDMSPWAAPFDCTVMRWGLAREANVGVAALDTCARVQHVCTEASYAALRVALTGKRARRGLHQPPCAARVNAVLFVHCAVTPFPL